MAKSITNWIIIFLLILVISSVLYVHYLKQLKEQAQIANKMLKRIVKTAKKNSKEAVNALNKKVKGIINGKPTGIETNKDNDQGQSNQFDDIIEPLTMPVPAPIVPASIIPLPLSPIPQPPVLIQSPVTIPAWPVVSDPIEPILSLPTACPTPMYPLPAVPCTSTCSSPFSMPFAIPYCADINNRRYRCDQYARSVSPDTDAYDYEFKRCMIGV